MSNNVYEMVTKRILEQLEQGIIPWHKPWTGSSSAWSRSTGKAYSLLNQLFMPVGEYATFNQIRKEGGKVKKGEKGYPVVFYKPMPITEKDENGNEIVKRMVPYLKYYTVFNIETQVEGLEKKYNKEDIEKNNQPIETLETIKNEYLDRESIKFEHVKQNSAYYQPATDSITMPLIEQFDGIEEYYSTAFHEMAHSTGHQSRLDRIKKVAAFGSEDYGKEELIAEITAAAVLNSTGIETSKTLKNSAAYIQNWTNAIKADNKLIVHASSKAQKAYNLIMNINEDA